MKLSWSQVEEYTKLLSESIIKSGYTPDVIIGVGVSGLVPLTLLVKMMPSSSVDTIIISTYNGSSKGLPKIISAPSLDLKDKRVLLVDDIVSSGTTMEHAIEAITKLGAKDIKFAAPVVSSLVCKKYPDYYGIALTREPDDWITFPWDEYE